MSLHLVAASPEPTAPLPQPLRYCLSYTLPGSPSVVRVTHFSSALTRHLWVLGQTVNGVQVLRQWED